MDSPEAVLYEGGYERQTHDVIRVSRGVCGLKKSEPLGRWIEQWSSDLVRSVETLDTEGWFVRGHDHDGGEDRIYTESGFLKLGPGTFICSPSRRG